MLSRPSVLRGDVGRCIYSGCLYIKGGVDTHTVAVVSV